MPLLLPGLEELLLQIGGYIYLECIIFPIVSKFLKLSPDPVLLR